MKRITSLPDLPPRGPGAHKGTFGHALIVAGSRGMSGAVILAGLAALRSGAGLVSLAIPNAILDVVASVEPSYLTLPLKSDRHGKISLHALDALFNKAAAMTATAIGPGLGQSGSLRRIVERLALELKSPVIIDADGLNNLAATGRIVPPQKLSDPTPPWGGPRIFTPHPGEFATLTGMTVKDIQKNRERLAAEFAKRNNVILVLKGAGTVVTDGERIFVNDTGNSGMGTGGTGDVLTGLIVSLLAQRMPPFDAAQLAVHIHGLAGDLAAAELSQPGLIASDLPDYIAEILSQMEEGAKSEKGTKSGKSS